MSESLGKRIKIARKASGLTQAALAKLCGWADGQTRVSNYENDFREPAFDDLKKIAIHTGKPVSYFLGEKHKNAEDAQMGSQQLHKLSADESDLLHMIRGLDFEKRILIERLVREMAAPVYISPDGPPHPKRRQ